MSIWRSHEQKRESSQRAERANPSSESPGRRAVEEAGSREEEEEREQGQMMPLFLVLACIPKGASPPWSSGDTLTCVCYCPPHHSEGPRADTPDPSRVTPDRNSDERSISQ